MGRKREVKKKNGWREEIKADTSRNESGVIVTSVELIRGPRGSLRGTDENGIPSIVTLQLPFRVE